MSEVLSEVDFDFDCVELGSGFGKCSRLGIVSTGI